MKRTIATLGARNDNGSTHVVIPDDRLGSLSVGLVYRDGSTWTYAHSGGHRRLEGFATQAAAVEAANVLLPFIDENYRAAMRDA